MVLLQFGVLEAQATRVARRNLRVGPPVGRRKLIGHPASDGLRRLGAKAAHGVRQIVDAVQDHLRRIRGAVGCVGARLPDVHDISSVFKLETHYSLICIDDLLWVCLPHSRFFGQLVAVPVLARPEYLAAIDALDHRAAPRVLGESHPRLVLDAGRCDFDNNLLGGRKKRFGISKQYKFK